MRLFRNLWKTIGLALFLIGLVLSPFVWTAGKVLVLAGEGALAEYRLNAIPPDRYVVEIRAALDSGDGDLARSLAALAASQRVTVPEELTARLAALPPIDVGNVLAQGWNCVVNGDFDSEAGFACVVATDVTGIGDVRDLIGQGTNYLTGQPVNYFTLGVASVGLTLSVSTFVSVGSLLPVRMGASFLKAMNKVGKLPPKLVAELGRALSRGINGKALDEAVLLAREFRFGELQQPLSRLFNPQSVRLVSNLATDFGTIGRVGGVRAMKLSAEAADSTRDVARLAKTAEKYQNRYLGVMKMLGRGVLRIGDLLLTLSGWLVGAALWALSMAWFVQKMTGNTARFAVSLFRRKAVAI